MCKNKNDVIERIVNYILSVWMYDYKGADREECEKAIKEIMEDFKDGEKES